MTQNTQNFDHWIRTDFVQINNQLEAIYAQQKDRANVEGVGDELKVRLVEQGNALIQALVAEGNTDEGFDAAFDLLGNVGLFMAACRRHEITEPSREHTSPLNEASALAMHIGASIGMAPRFATAHLCTHNKANNGVYKRFTDLEAEKIFVDYNTKAILAYKRASDALLRIQPLGISHPITADLFKTAAVALDDVLESNTTLFEKLTAEDFFYQVRTYYKPYKVGNQTYRGANAGDFAGINVIDLLTGLCNANEASYSQMLVDKFMFMMPEDQTILRDCMRLPSLMDDFLAQQHLADERWYQDNLTLFLKVCDKHGATADQHHDQLIEKYIAVPAKTMEQQHMDKVTASGPPLQALMASLENLRDRRAANQRDDIKTRFDDINTLRKLVK